MNAILVLIPITLVLVSIAVGIFFWAVRHDQFRHVDTPAILPVLDDVDPPGTFDDEAEDARAAPATPARNADADAATAGPAPGSPRQGPP